MSPTASLWVQNTIFNDKSAILLHPGTHCNKNFASQRQNYAQKMQDAQVTKSLYMYHYLICWSVYFESSQSGKQTEHQTSKLTSANISLDLNAVDLTLSSPKCENLVLCVLCCIILLPQLIVIKWQTDRQTVWTLIRLFHLEQYDLGPHFPQYWLLRYSSRRYRWRLYWSLAMKWLIKTPHLSIPFTIHIKHYVQ